MKIFLDTANIKEIKEALAAGLLDGVTTNPTLIARENRSYHKVLKEICEIVKGPVSAEVIGQTTEEMLKEAKEGAKGSTEEKASLAGAEAPQVKAELRELKGVGAKTAGVLAEAGIGTIEKLSEASVEDLTKLSGIGKKTAEKILQAAKEKMAQ